MHLGPAPIQQPHDVFFRLDRKELRGNWKPSIASSLLVLDQQILEADRATLALTTNLVCAHAAELADWERRGGGRTVRAENVQDEYPVTSTLLLRRRTVNSSRALDLLLAVLCEVALDRNASLERAQIVGLAAILRGGLEKSPNSRIQLILGDADTLASLQLNIERHLDQPGKPHHFANPWRKWLRDRIIHWMARNRADLAPDDLSPTIDTPALPVISDDQAEPDDTVDIPVANNEDFGVGETEQSPRAERDEGLARQLLRASDGDLLIPADFRVPEEIIARLARGAIATSVQRQAQGSSIESEPYVAFAMAVATGVREMDLAQITWGTPREAIAGSTRRILSVDPNRVVFYRSIVCAPNAFAPDAVQLSVLQDSYEAVEWPLPPTLHRLLLGLTPASIPTVGALIFPAYGDPDRRPERLQNVVAALQPGLALGAGVVRFAMAAHLAQRLGPDVAQLALRDTFSMSAAATYYSAPLTTDITAAVRGLHIAWFGEASDPGAIDQKGHIGSRLVLKDEAARAWPASLRQQRRSAIHRKDSTHAAWIAHRNFLAAALCAATAHRPMDAIGAIDLDQVIPEHGLIILQDKQVDPLRRYRIAATGARWTTELREYLDRLIEISKDRGTPAGRLAMAVLLSEAPLFSVPPGGDLGKFSAAQLSATMPSYLQPSPNHYRHRLNQRLQRAGLDPELRFAQMGWVLSAAHATADLSPMAACDLGAELGPVIDEFLFEDGWFVASQRVIRWRWDGVPMRPLVNWGPIVAKHEEEHDANIKRIRQDLRERGKDAEEAVLPRLADAIRVFLPSLRLDVKRRRLVREPGGDPHIRTEVDEGRCGLVLDRVRSGDKRRCEALEAVTARILMARLIRRSHRDGLTFGVVPRRPKLTVTAEPSPFLPGCGLAIRHVGEIRQRLLEQVREGRAHDQGVLAAIGILCFSPYREVTIAQAATAAAPRAVRGQQPGDFLRIDAALDRKSFPMVVGGVAALLLAQRGRDAPTAHSPDVTKINAWLQKHAPSLMPPDNDRMLDFAAMTLRAAGRLELSGPERLLMLGTVAMASTSVERCLALDDRWPVRTRETAEARSDDIPETLVEPEATTPASTSPSSVDAGYRELTALLNPDLLPKALGKKGDGHRGWKQALARALADLRRKVGPTTTLGLVTGFSAHRLQHGGQHRKELQHDTLHTEVTRFARDLLLVVGTRSLVDMDSDSLLAVYLAVLKRKEGLSSRPLVLEALRIFQRYLEEAHQVDSVSFAQLQSMVGPRVSGKDPGLVTDPEAHAVFDVLLGDLSSERSRQDASPNFIRTAELRVMAFLILEASGARPKSVHGLVLGDLHLLGEGRDFVHLHRTGSYGSVKTTSAIGFVSLEGELWAGARPWVLDWLTKERSRLTLDQVWKTPLFAHEPGSRERFARDVLLHRIDALLRWATNEPRAHAYWLRKRRVMARHAAANAGFGPHRARDVQTALCLSGHALVLTPLESYVSDPAIPLARSLRQGRRTSRANFLTVTKLEPDSLDMAWVRRGGEHGEKRLAVVFDRLEFPSTQPPPGRYVDPPPMRRQMGLLPLHVDTFARALQKQHAVDRAMIRAGLSGQQVERLQIAASDLVVQAGRVPWRVEGLRHPRAVMKAPRKFAGAEGLFDLLKDPPAPELTSLASTWASRGHVARLVENDAMLLASEAEVGQARNILKAARVDPANILVSGAAPVITLQICRPGTSPRDKAPSRKSLMAAFIWVLSIVWLQQRLVVAKQGG